jgi:hypothetical protein
MPERRHRNAGRCDEDDEDGQRRLTRHEYPKEEEYLERRVS